MTILEALEANRERCIGVVESPSGRFGLQARKASKTINVTLLATTDGSKPAAIHRFASQPSTTKIRQVVQAVRKELRSDPRLASSELAINLKVGGRTKRQDSGSTASQTEAKLVLPPQKPVAEPGAADNKELPPLTIAEALSGLSDRCIAVLRSLDGKVLDIRAKKAKASQLEVYLADNTYGATMLWYRTIF